MVDTHILIQGFGRNSGRKSSSKKRPLSLKNSSPDSKADFSEKFVFGILEVNIECVAYNIEYSIYKRAYLK